MPIYALGEDVPDIHPDTYVHPDAVVIGKVVLRAGCSVWPTAVLRGDYGWIYVGERTSVQDGTIVHTVAESPTDIGADVVVGHNAHLEGCRIEPRCLVGSASVVMKGALVQTGAIVGGGAFVNENMVVPSGHLALGVPARTRPMGDARHTDWVDYAIQEYLDNAARYRSDLRRLDG